MGVLDHGLLQGVGVFDLDASNSVRQLPLAEHGARGARAGRARAGGLAARRDQAGAAPLQQHTDPEHNAGAVLPAGLVGGAAHHVLLLRLHADPRRHLHRHNRVRSAGVPADAAVPVRGGRRRRARRVRPLLGARAGRRPARRRHRRRLGAHGPLAAHGRDGHGAVRDVHRAHPPAVAEGVDAAADGPAAVRRVLGVLLLLHLHHQRHGQGRHQAGREPDERGGAAPAAGRRAARRAQALAARQARLPLHAPPGTLLHARAGRHRDAGPAAVLRAALRRLQEGVARVPAGPGARPALRGLAADVLPLLAAGLLPGAADGHGVGRGVQGGAARAAVPRALHAAAAAHHGLRQGRPETDVERAVHSAGQGRRRLRRLTRPPRAQCGTVQPPGSIHRSQ